MAFKIVKCLSANPANTKVSISKKTGKEVTPQGSTAIIAYEIEFNGKKAIYPKKEACDFILNETARKLLGKKPEDKITKAELEALPVEKQLLIGCIDNAKVARRGSTKFIRSTGKSFYEQKGMVECIFVTETVKKENKKTKEVEEIVQVASPKKVTKKEYEAIAKLAPEKKPVNDDPDKDKKQSPASAKSLIGMFA